MRLIFRPNFFLSPSPLLPPRLSLRPSPDGLLLELLLLLLLLLLEATAAAAGSGSVGALAGFVKAAGLG